MSPQQCPLCLSGDIQSYYKTNLTLSNPSRRKPEQTDREFFQCHDCKLIFVPPEQFLSRAEEENQYNFHQNNSDDPNYRKFLGQLFNPMIELLKENARGLDYGSGPGPTLSVMFEEQGYKTNIYDYIYSPDKTVLDINYDFITCTETIEHFRTPRDDVFKLWAMLGQGGYLGIMTSLFNNQINFSDWHYKNDPTHICFYSSETINWLAKQWKAAIVYQCSNVIILQKLTEAADK